MLGRQVAHESYYRDFVRVGGAYGTDIASFFVTASQVKALIETHCPRDHTLVLVGGDSVLMGAGQPIRYLWTKALQGRLGNRYCVFNLAVPAGWLEGYASVTLEMVANEYRHALLVSNTQVPTLNEPDGMYWYKHFFWDAYYKGLLEHSTVKWPQKRLAQIDGAYDRAAPSDKARRSQVRLGMWLDSYLYFNDLWTYIDYNYFMTIFVPSSGIRPWLPRRDRPDYDYEVDREQVRKLGYYPAPGSDQFKSDMAIVRGWMVPFFSATPAGRVIDETAMAAAEKEVRESTVTEFSGMTVITMIPESPYYLDKLTPSEKREYEYLLKRKAALMSRYGYHVVTLDDVAAEDYGDRTHLNTFGGFKLAREVADEIKSIAPSTP